jgi:hypothetical protein
VGSPFQDHAQVFFAAKIGTPRPKTSSVNHVDVEALQVPAQLVPRQLLGGERVGQCHGVREELAPHGCRPHP